MEINSQEVEQRVSGFKEACRKAGVKLTHQRLEIFREMAQTVDHPDAESVYNSVRERVPTVSMDTVYRTLWMLNERFARHADLVANCTPAMHELSAAFAARPLAEWIERLANFTGQWAVVQDSVEVISDPQTVANGYLQECYSAEGTAFRLVAAPVQYNGSPAVPTRAPQFNEHCEEILGEIGLDMDAIIQLKIDGVVA